MNDPNATAPNTAQVNRRVELLNLIRANGSMIVGWADNEICPPDANALIKAGLAVMDDKGNARTGGTIRPA